jgi:cyclophilin family peptidyl-prolyl cis-trans isomerase
MLVRRLYFCAFVFLMLSFAAAVSGADLMAPDSEVAVIETNYGKIVMEFFPNAAPNHVANFKKLARQGFYDGSQFHRVISGFMIQGGDPNSKDSDPSNDGTGNAGYQIKAEFNKISHKRGIVSMARGAYSVDSASCQWFIMLADTPRLDGQYTVFGNVIEGMAVVDKIGAVKVDSRDHPLQPVIMKKVTIEKRATQTAPKQ